MIIIIIIIIIRIVKVSSPTLVLMLKEEDELTRTRFTEIQEFNFNTEFIKEHGTVRENLIFSFSFLSLKLVLYQKCQ